MEARTLIVVVIGVFLTIAHTLVDYVITMPNMYARGACIGDDSC